MISNPVAEIRIASPEDGPPSAQSVPVEAVVIDSREFSMDVTLDTAVGEDGPEIAVNMDIVNLPRDFRDYLEGGAFVFIDAGYPAEAGTAGGMRRLYSGIIEYGYRYKAGGAFRTHIAASQMPESLRSVHVPFTIRRPMLIGRAMQQLGRGAGIDVHFDPATQSAALGLDPRIPREQVTIQEWNATQDVITELERMRRRLSSMTGREMMVIPDAASPYVYTVLDRAAAEAIPGQRIDIEQGAVMSASPVVVKAGTDQPISTDPATGLQQTTIENMEGELHVLEYNIQMQFDPRFRIGVPFEPVEGPNAIGRVTGITKISQSLGNPATTAHRTWSTAIQGPFIVESVLAERRQRG